MQANDPGTLETTLADGRRMTLSLPRTDAPWAADGIGALRVVPPTHTGRAAEPQPLPERPVLPLEVALLAF
ncbi:hypothetical protein [Streptomyces sp. NRRL S-87]|uniref:hypothetical protein n=1 Tax=Streptomyces sp. NRRL S-87 TaxID=1463920 RepID=UPI0004BF1820|nr:hypothetical protein [Streptomyces sp. NRRL S-87]